MQLDYFWINVSQDNISNHQALQNQTWASGRFGLRLTGFERSLKFFNSLREITVRLGMFLGQYKNKRKLGRGTYGYVYLVQDKQGKEYALKMICKDAISQQPEITPYLQEQINVMKTLDSPYIIKIQNNFEDQEYLYMLLEYCNGGDLLTYQSSLKGKIFTVDAAVDVLSDVIRGMVHMHEHGYLHRDLKLENILVCNNKDGSKTFKLADFGFSKPQNQMRATNVGTDLYKAPEVYLEEEHGYWVDMWSFGILFYHMLNLAYPFKPHPFMTQAKKGQEILKLAQNFSYKASVNATKLRRLQNCTKDLQDLFAAMFNPVAQKRISFLEIRQHPVFAHKFPQVIITHTLLKQKSFKPRNSLMAEVASPGLKNIKSRKILLSRVSRQHTWDPNLSEERALLGKRKDRIDFLRQNADLFFNCGYTLTNQQKMMLVYNLYKYYVILLRKFQKQFDVPYLQKQYPGNDWAGYSKTKQYKDLQTQVTQDQSRYEMKFMQLHDRCEEIIELIKKINPAFMEAFTSAITDTEFDGAFKRSYRASTAHVYKTLLNQYRSGNKSQQICFLICMNTISHAFNMLFDDYKNLGIVFKPYLQATNTTAENMNYSQLKKWLSNCGEPALSEITHCIIEVYLKK